MPRSQLRQKGLLFYIEGGEGSGKDLQTDWLLKQIQLRGFRAVRGREPGGVPIAEKIRGIINNPQNDIDPLTEVFLFEAARSEYFREFVIPHLKEGYVVVSDRSGLSTLAYQGHAGGVNLEFIEKLNRAATQGVKPDLTFILDVPPEVGLARETDPDRFAEKGPEYHKKVNEGYRQIAETHGAILLPYRDGDPETTHREI